VAAARGLERAIDVPYCAPFRVSLPRMPQILVGNLEKLFRVGARARHVGRVSGLVRRHYRIELVVRLDLAPLLDIPVRQLRQDVRGMQQ
jgi:hypothetical protein